MGFRSGAQFRRDLAIVIGAVDFALALVRYVVGISVEAHAFRSDPATRDKNNLRKNILRIVLLRDF